MNGTSPSPFGKDDLTRYFGSRARTQRVHSESCDLNGVTCLMGWDGCESQPIPPQLYVATVTGLRFWRQEIWTEVHVCCLCGRSQASSAAWVLDGGRQAQFLCYECDAHATHVLQRLVEV